MALPTGSISFTDLQSALGGSNPISMNEYGVYIGLTANTTSSHNLNQFRGLADHPTSWPSYVWDTTQSHTFQAGFTTTFQWQSSNSRVKIGYWGYNSSAASSINYAYSNGWNPNETPQVKVVWTANSSGTTTQPSLSSGTWYSLSSSRTYGWVVNGSSSQSRSLNGNVTLYLKNSLGEITRASQPYFISETQGQQGPGGPGGGGYK